MKIVWNEPNGTMAVLHPTKEHEKDIDLLLKGVPIGTSYDIVEDTEIPTDRRWRESWKHDKTKEIGQKCQIDMNIAKLGFMVCVRLRRDTKLKDLDIEQLKGNDVDASKQLLRDLPNNLEVGSVSNALTLQELESIWNDENLGNMPPSFCIGHKDDINHEYG